MINAENLVKSTVHKLIKNISIIAIFVTMSIVSLLYLGPDMTLNTKLAFRLAVPSVILAISLIILYDLWIKNGKQSAYAEDDYRETVDEYMRKSHDLKYKVLQQFIDYEYQRRYDVEKNRIEKLIDRNTSLLDKLNSIENKSFKVKLDIKRLSRQISKLKKSRLKIKVNIPYNQAEQFDYLRYTKSDSTYKEYSPSDTKKHLMSARTKKYTMTILLTVVGFNIITIGGQFGDTWSAIIMISLACVSVLFTVVSGFTTGYKNINIISKGIYSTATSFLDKAVGYCKDNNLELRHSQLELDEAEEPLNEDIIVEEMDDMSRLFKDDEKKL